MNAPVSIPGTAHSGRFARQRARAAQLDEIRLQRRLTDAEQQEADRLAQRLYMRVWREQQRERFGAGW